MSEIEVNGQWYRCNRLPTRTQLHVAKRLIPVLQGLTPLFHAYAPQLAQQQLQAQTDPETGETVMVPAAPQITIEAAIAALGNTIGLLSDADADFILDTALSCVQWRQQGRWIPLLGPGGVLMNNDADDLALQLRLLWEVLSQSLANFSLATLLPSQPMTGNGMDPTAMARPAA